MEKVVEVSCLGPDAILYRLLPGQSEKNRTDLLL